MPSAVTYYLNLLIAGLALGAVYALYGLGITVIYKATKVPNFAQAALGVVGAYVFFKTWSGQKPRLHEQRVTFKVPFAGWAWRFVPPHLPMWGSFLAALVVVAVLGLLIERLVMRRIAGAPTLTLIIVTVALLAVILALASDIFSPEAEIVNDPFGIGSVHIAGLNAQTSSIGILTVALVLAVALGVFFKFTTLGVAVRATADSREVSRLLGIDANRVASFSWAVGSMIACIGGILISPARGLNAFALATLIVPGFAASLLGGFTSLTGTVAGGLALGASVDLLRGVHWPKGILSNIFAANGSESFIILAVVVVVLMARPKFIFKGLRLDEDSGVSFARTGSGLNAEDRVRRALDRNGALSVLLADWSIGRWVLGGLAGVVLLAVPVLTTSYWSTVLCFGVIYALVALSIIVLTGWTGQLSLAPLTFLGVGGYATAILSTSAHLPFWLTIPLSGLVSIPFAVILGVPALRLRGFFLALVTLCFAAAGSDWLFVQPTLAQHQRVSRGVLTAGFSQPTYYVSLLVAAGVFIAVRNLSRTHIARTFFALRDSESTAVSMGIDPVRYKLLAFAMAGAIGGVAGGLLAYLAPTIQPINYAFAASLAWVLNTVVASATVLAGAVVAGFLFSIVPQLTASPTGGVNQAPVILGGITAILTVTDYPNGLASFLTRLVRRFDSSEAIAWTTDEEGANPAVAAAEFGHDDADFDRAVELVGAPIGGAHE